jgi:hypothetical protein
VARPTYYEDVPTVYVPPAVYGPVIGIPPYGGGYYGPRPGRRPPGMGGGGGRFPPVMGGGGRYPGRIMGGGGLRLPSGGGRIMGTPSRGGYGGGRGLGSFIR